jgi:hypothetical protein
MQLKLLKYLAQISLPAYGEEKNKCKKTFTCFLLTAQRLTAASVTVTYNDKGGRKKRESYDRY